MDVRRDIIFFRKDAAAGAENRLLLRAQGLRRNRAERRGRHLQAGTLGEDRRSKFNEEADELLRSAKRRRGALNGDSANKLPAGGNHAIAEQREATHRHGYIAVMADARGAEIDRSPKSKV